MRKASINRIVAQRGVTLTETLLVLALAAALAAAAYRAYGTASNDAKTSELSNGAITMIGKIKQVWGASGDYTTLAPATLEQSGILPVQFRTNRSGSTLATEIRDTFGNVVSITGTQGSFTLGFERLSPDTCTTLAPVLASQAYRIRAGSGAAAANGVASGGQVYKDPTATSMPQSGLDVAALTAACGDSDVANRILVAEIR